MNLKHKMLIYLYFIIDCFRLYNLNSIYGYENN